MFYRITLICFKFCFDNYKNPPWDYQW